MPARTSPSPSPPPMAPQATNTGPGPRAAALQKIYISAIQSTLKSNSYHNFSSCFPTPAKYCPTALEGVWRQLNTRLEEECLKDFKKILEERKVIEGLNSLDILITQATERKNRGIQGEEPFALHTLTAQQLSDTNTHSFRAKSKQELEEKINLTQQDNQKITEDVKAQRVEVEQLISGLEALVGDLDGAVKALEEINGEEMRRDVWAADQEMKDVD